MFPGGAIMPTKKRTPARKARPAQRAVPRRPPQKSATEKRLPRWWRAYLAALAKTGNRTQAAAAAKIDRTTPWKYLEGHPGLKEEWTAAVAEAIDASMDLLEQEARRRAEEGVLEPVYQGGKKVGTIRRYSDTLLIFLLNGGRPEKYRHRHELTGKGGAPLVPPVLNVVVKRGRGA